ncbi:MAG TPA: ATP-binding protein [Dehalococcoidia bacterium]|nr:ATP-binding protein [Dehalococcoidia bacterium]
MTTDESATQPQPTSALDRDELERIAERYRLFLSRTGEGIARFELAEPVDVTLDVEAQIAKFYEHASLVECNEALARMYRLPSADVVIGLPLALVFPLDDEGAQRDVRSFVTNDYRIVDAPSRSLAPDGTLTQFMWDVTGVVRDGLVHEAWFRIRDVTQQHELEAELEQTRRMDAVGQLAAGLAHDFNNLLTVISMNLGAARGEDAERAQPFLETAENALTSAAELADQMLTIGSRTDAYKRPVVLKPLVDEVVALLALNVHPNTQIEMDIAPELAVYAAPGQLQHMILNLASNGNEAMPHGGTLTVRATLSSDDRPRGLEPADHGHGYLVIEVEDTGTGMDEETVSHVFEPYFTTKEDSSHGLGMSVIYGVVQEHGGSIAIDSAVGRGTTVSIWLSASTLEQAEETPWGQGAGDHRTDPATRLAAALAPEAPPDDATPGGGDGAHVLVVDDRADIRTICRKVLAKSGYEVTLASSGEEAVELVRAAEHPPDLALIDVTMPGISGPETVETLHSEHASMRAIMMTGYADGLVDPRGPHHAMVLRKPFDNDALVEAVRAVLSGQLPGPADGDTD